MSTKARLVKAMVFPVVMYGCDGCESWAVKKAERRRIDAFELWCWRRLLRVPWTARRSNQSILKVRPTPFCLLDEIDAALDDRNVERFAKYLRSLAKVLEFQLHGGAGKNMFGIQLIQQSLSSFSHTQF